MSSALVGAFNVDAVEHQHMKVNIQIDCTPKALDQRDRPSVGGAAGKAGLSDQMRGNRPIDDAQHLAHDRRS